MGTLYCLLNFSKTVLKTTVYFRKYKHAVSQWMKALKNEGQPSWRHFARNVLI